MRMNRRRLLSVLALAALGPGCARPPKMAPVPAGEVVLALGDSLTSGMGAPAEASYPAELERLTGWRVVNAGIPGDTAAGALARLPALLQEHAPRLVLVSIGGNDFLRRSPATETRASIRAICQQATAAGAQVLLVAVPEFSMLAAVAHSLSDHALYAGLAGELKLPLHADGWSHVLGDAALRSDAIHGNAQGYAAFARGLAETAREVGLLAGR